tara:strand:+ start:2621 stop:3421 length:801 start_codon:yes stop_codon:yes gene_type:complete
MSNVFYNANNLVINNGFIKNPNRYYLEEWFKLVPAASGDIAFNKNIDFELSGTGSQTSTFNTLAPGINILTSNTANNNSIIEPHTNVSHVSWNRDIWKTGSELEWECSISIPDKTSIKFWAGLKLSPTNLIETDSASLFFKFQTTQTGSEEFSDYTKLHFIYSDGSNPKKQYVSELPITIDVDTPYNLRITIDRQQLARIFVNGIQYNITHDVGSSPYGSTVTDGDIPSTAFLEEAILKPYIGVQTETANSKTLNVYYQKMSRSLI